MSDTALVASGSSFPASQSDVEGYTGSGYITSSNIQYAIGALTSIVNITYQQDTSGLGGGSSNRFVKITSITGHNLADWAILDPLTQNAAWIIQGGCQVYLGDRTKNLLAITTLPFNNGSSNQFDGLLLDTSAASHGLAPANSWILQDPFLRPGFISHATVVVTVAAFRRAL